MERTPESQPNLSGTAAADSKIDELKLPWLIATGSELTVTEDVLTCFAEEGLRLGMCAGGSAAVIAKGYERTIEIASGTDTACAYSALEAIGAVGYFNGVTAHVMCIHVKCKDSPHCMKKCYPVKITEGVLTITVAVAIPSRSSCSFKSLIEWLPTIADHHPNACPVVWTDRSVLGTAIGCYCVKSKHAYAGNVAIAMQRMGILLKCHHDFNDLTTIPQWPDAILEHTFEGVKGGARIFYEWHELSETLRGELRKRTLRFGSPPK